MECPNCDSVSARPVDGLCPRCLLEPSLLVEEERPLLQPGKFSVPSREELERLLPRYRFEEQIGRGGMGVVFAALDPRLGRRVAIKVLPVELAADPTFEQRFEREARTQARLSHPFMVTLLDYGEAGPFFYLVLEHVPGGNLRQAPSYSVTPARALRWVTRTCEALAYAHEEGVVHRDIKPENILIDASDNPRLADFGLVKLAGPSSSAPELTGTHALLGSPHYLPPEQLQGGGARADARGDVYSLGVVLYELLTGTLPLGRFPPPSATSGVSSALDPLVLRCLERDPADRFEDASALLEELELLQERLFPRSPAKRRLRQLQTLASPAGAAGAVARSGAAARDLAVGVARRSVAPAENLRTVRLVVALTCGLGFLLSLFPWASNQWIWERFVLLLPGALLPLTVLATGAFLLLGRRWPRVRPPAPVLFVVSLYGFVHWGAMPAFTPWQPNAAWGAFGMVLLVLLVLSIRLWRGERRPPVVRLLGAPEPQPEVPAPEPSVLPDEPA